MKKTIKKLWIRGNKHMAKKTRKLPDFEYQRVRKVYRDKLRELQDAWRDVQTKLSAVELYGEIIESDYEKTVSLTSEMAGEALRSLEEAYDVTGSALWKEEQLIKRWDKKN